MRHPLAYIHPEAQVAEDVNIDPFASIQKNVEIGSGTWIGSNVTIMEGARIGRNCKIFPGAVISAIPQDLKFEDENTTVDIGDNVTIRECVTIHRGTKASNQTIIKDNCLLMAYSHIAHDCIIGKNAILANNVNLAGHIDVGDFAILGGLTAVHQFVNIGAHAFIAGGSLVRKDVPPYVKAAREPLSYVGVNSIGLRRRGFSNKVINEILDIYRVLYVRHSHVGKAISIIEAELPVTKERDEILDFVRGSIRGMMRGLANRYEN